MEARPGYREHASPPAAREAVACLWSRVAAPGDPVHRVLPDACADLVWQAGVGAMLAGPDTRAALVPAPAGGGVWAGLRFRPGAAGPALGLPLEEVRDARIPLEDVRRDLAERLPGDLAPEEALRRLAAVGAELAAAGPPDPAISAAARRLAQPRTRVEALAGELGLSERQLRRRCHAAVGHGPKALQRILRLQGYLARADAAGPQADLAWLAVASGYADQAHLTRECTRLAGVAPAALARARAAVA
jgi:AraC-like DNA-binding protein